LIDDDVCQATHEKGLGRHSGPHRKETKSKTQKANSKKQRKDDPRKRATHRPPDHPNRHNNTTPDKHLPELSPDTEFVPFVVETGGRLAKATYEWLDSFRKDVTEERARKLRQAAVRSLCVDVQRQLFMSNANMLYKFAHHLTEMRMSSAAH